MIDATGAAKLRYHGGGPIPDSGNRTIADSGSWR